LKPRALKQLHIPTALYAGIGWLIVGDRRGPSATETKTSRQPC